MKTMHGIDLYAPSDVLYSKAGFIALNDKLEPCGIFVPGLKGYEDVESTDELSENDLKLERYIDGYKQMVGF